MDISQDMQSLLEKLDALELTEGERTAFGQLLGVGDDDVEGFYYNKIAFEFAPTVQGFNTGILMEKMRVMGGPIAGGDLGSDRVIDTTQGDG